MAGGIKDWARLYEQIYKHLKPGGWVEMQEYEAWVRSDDDTIENAKSVLEWQNVVDEASTRFGKKMNVAETQKQKLVDAGFVDVREDVYKVPIGPWAKESSLKEQGRYELAQMSDAVEPFSLALFTRVLGWSNEKAQVLFAGVRADFRNPKNHLYIAYHFVYGRKPEES